MQLEFIFVKLSAPLAVAALAFGVWAWHAVPDYVSPPVAPVPPAFTSSSPRYAAADSMSLPWVRLQRRARLAPSRWSVRVTR